VSRMAGRVILARHPCQIGLRRAIPFSKWQSNIESRPTPFRPEVSDCSTH
jgi:hypothetical protein